MVGPSYLADPVVPAVADLIARIATAAATSHVLVIAPHGVAVTMAVRRIAHTWPGPDGFAARWTRGLIQWWTQGGLTAIASNRDRPPGHPSRRGCRGNGTLRRARRVGSPAPQTSSSITRTTPDPSSGAFRGAHY